MDYNSQISIPPNIESWDDYQAWLETLPQDLAREIGDIDLSTGPWDLELNADSSPTSDALSRLLSSFIDGDDEKITVDTTQQAVATSNSARRFAGSPTPYLTSRDTSPPYYLADPKTTPSLPFELDAPDNTPSISYIEAGSEEDLSVGGQIKSFGAAVGAIYGETADVIHDKFLKDVRAEHGLDKLEGLGEIPTLQWEIMANYLSIRLSRDTTHNIHDEFQQLLMNKLGLSVDEVNSSSVASLIMSLDKIVAKLRGNAQYESGTFDDFLAETIRNNPGIHANIEELSQNGVIQNVYHQYDLVKQAQQEIETMQDAASLVSYLAPFQADDDSMSVLYEQLGIHKEWIDSAREQLGKTKIESGPYKPGYYESTSEKVVTIDPVKPSDCPQHIWDLCLEMVQAQKTQEFNENVKSIFLIAVPIGLSFLATLLSGGTAAPFCLTVISGMTGAYGLYEEWNDIAEPRNAIEAAHVVGDHNPEDFSIGGDNLVSRSNVEINNRLTSDAVGAASGFIPIPGSKLVGAIASPFIEQIAVTSADYFVNQKNN